MSEIKTRFRTIDGLSIRYAQSAEHRDIEALVLAPWPESLYAYDASWSRLAQDARLTAVDLPGFGHSELRADLLSPQAMGEFVVRIADAFELEKPHVVAPDVGTSAALFAAAAHPDRFRSLAVGAGGVAVPIELGDPLRAWVFAEDLAPYRAMGPKEVVKIALGTIKGYELPETVREDYLAAYAGERFADQIPYVQAYREQLPVLADLLPALQTPVQIISGASDAVVPPANGEYLHRLLPNSRLDVIDKGHFFWEEGADTFAHILTDWWLKN
jgi:pimeloyl-ACP methyl ester carboxylesterase